MTDQTTSESNSDKPLNGAPIIPPAPAAAPMPPARTSSMPSRTDRMSAGERLLSQGDRDSRDSSFDGLSRFTSTATAPAADAKLTATTRMVNAFVGYLTNACGRQADQMSEADVAALGSMLGIVERLDVTPKGRGGH